MWDLVLGGTGDEEDTCVVGRRTSSRRGAAGLDLVCSIITVLFNYVSNPSPDPTWGLDKKTR